MSEIPGELKYSKSHEWVKIEDDGTVVIGVTEHAQDLLGDMVYVEVPEVDSDVEVEDACAVVESVKAASDIYSPVSGTIVASNDALTDAPEMVNSDPYGEGWIMRIKLADRADLDQLMDASAYADHVEAEDH